MSQSSSFVTTVQGLLEKWELKKKYGKEYEIVLKK